MDVFQYNTIVVMLGTSLLGALAGVVGAFAVLRRRALTGDAVAHAALPGLCIAFWIVGERNLPAMLLGAFASGILGILMVSGLRRATRIKEDAAIGIVLSVFYGAGIVLSTMIQRKITSGSKAGLDSYILGKTAGMIEKDVYLIAAVAVICMVVIFVLYKEFKVVAFDPGFAGVQGLPVLILDLALMTMVAITVVIGLPAVGVVMIVALLIIPAAAARFWTDHLGSMLLISAFIGVVTGMVGTVASAHASNLPAGPIIVLAGSSLFILSMLFAPRRGLIRRWRQRVAFKKRVADQRLLNVLFEHSESGGTRISVRELLTLKSWTMDELLDSIDRLREEGCLETDTEKPVRLTTAGLQRAARVSRGRRLWNLFMSEYAEMVGHYADMDSESVDKILPRETVEELEAKLIQSGRMPDVTAGANL